MVFFALAISGCVGFVVFCSLHPTDLVAPDYYERELRYQGQIQRMGQAQAQATTVRYDAATQRIQVSFPAELMRSGVSGSIQLYRPFGRRIGPAVEARTGRDRGSDH